jgi:hypothetical protein
VTNGFINRIDYWICGSDHFCARDNAPMAHKNRVRQHVVDGYYSVLHLVSSSCLNLGAGAE